MSDFINDIKRDGAEKALRNKINNLTFKITQESECLKFNIENIRKMLAQIEDIYMELKKDDSKEA